MSIHFCKCSNLGLCPEHAAQDAVPADTDDSGECQRSDWCGPGSHCLCVPAARPAEHDHTRFRNDDGPWSPCPPSCPARPAEPPGELRKQIRDELGGWPLGAGYYQYTVASDDAAEMADALLSGPVAPLLEKLRRVEVALRHIGKEGRISSFPLNVGYRDSAKIIARALDGS